MAKIRLTPVALSDLKEIKEYITNDLCNPVAANNVINKIIKDYTLLEMSPLLGTPLAAKVTFETDYRFLVSGNYIVFYKSDNDYVSIYRILYGRRDYIKVLFGDICKADEE